MATPQKNKLSEYVSTHFKWSDFTCPCCERIKIIPAFFTHVRMLEELQDILTFPIEIITGYTCMNYSLETKQNLTTWHTLFATDVRPKQECTGMKLSTIYMGAIEIGFTGVGLYDDHVHIDLRPEPLKWKV